MARTFFFTVCAAMLMLVGCGPATGPVQRRDTTSRGPVGVWLQDDPDLSVDMLQDACAIWSPTGFSCVVSDYASAGVRIYVSRGDCVVTDGHGHHVLATTYRDGSIVVDDGCLPYEFGAPSERPLRIIIAHELGHTMGLPHVNPDCTAKDLPEDRSSGAPICGKAIMNPILNPNVDQMTGADWLNYETRASGSGPISGPRDETVCNYLAPAQ